MKDKTQLINQYRDIYSVDFEKFACDCLMIRPKSGGIIPFTLNNVQKDFVRRFKKQMQLKGLARFIILKARQQGMSTLIEALIFWWTIFHGGYKGLVLTHLDASTNELFEITRRYYNNVPTVFKPKAHNDSSNELVFRGIDSAIKTATAGSKNTAHGSTFQGLHWSEVSRSRNQDEMVTGVLQTVPQTVGTMVFLESTANGIGDYFHETWQSSIRGESQFEPVFYAWYLSDEYRIPVGNRVFNEQEREYQQLHQIDDEQLAWRQFKIENMRGSYDKKLRTFQEQYPSTPEEAFISDSSSFINPVSVERAMKAFHDPVGAVILGIDPARQGRDSTGFVVRQGRKVVYIGRARLEDTMAIVGKTGKLIEQHKPDAVFIDAIGVGAGVYDRLIELGYDRVFQAIVSKRAEKEHTYVNKRAEMWANLSDWLDNGADLPESAALRDDLLLLSYGLDSNGRVKLESKKNLKRSPDLGDALALTFFAPVAVNNQKYKRSNHEKENTDFGARIRV